MEVIHSERMSFFEVERTPPDEKRRRERAAEEAAKENAEILLLTPFAQRPTIDFNRVKLGKSGVRKLIIRNPGDKPLDVVLDKLPKEEKGFNIDYVAFTLGGKEETSLLIGWTPTKAGGARENIIVKFGGKFSAQIILIGTCLEPESKRRPAANTTLTKPLGPRNTNVRGANKARPSVTASKLNAPPKIPIPANPVVRKQGSPPKRMFGEVSQQENARPGKFVCGTAFNPGEFARSSNFDNQDLRRETYVQEPTVGNIVESTPRVNRNIEDKVEATFDTRLSNIMPPPVVDSRRQTFVPRKDALATVIDESYQEEDDTDFRRQTFVKLPQPPTVAPVNNRETFVKLPPPNLPSNDSSKQTYVKLPKPDVNLPGEVKEEALTEEAKTPENKAMDLSLAPLNLSSAKPKALSALLDQLNDVKSEPLDLSFPSEKKDDKPKVEVESKNNTLNITEANFTPRRYCPRVSDISLPDNEGSVNKQAEVMTPLKMADTKTPLKDPRLMQLMGAMNISGCGNLDLSLGSQFGDCSLAVNLASPGRDRDIDFEEEELDNFEDNKENIDEDELEMIARARGSSALGSRSASSSWTEKSPRLSTGTIVKTDPTIDMELLPTVTETNFDNVEVDTKEILIEKQTTETVNEIVTEEEVVEEVIELEFEIVNGKKTLVGERTVTKDMENLCPTPTEVRRQAQCDISKIIEQHLGNKVPEQVKPRAFNITEDQCEKAPVFKVDHVKPVVLDKTQTTTCILEPDLVSTDQVNEGATIDVNKLPGLKGSPRISNQVVKHPDNFLCVTVNETSFMPPSPDDPRRCSTGVKNKDNAPSKTPSPNALVRKSLFAGQQDDAASTLSGVHLNSQGFVLPVISNDNEAGDEKRLSTDTYIAGAESGKLSTIQEDESVSRSNAQVTASLNQEETIVRREDVTIEIKAQQEEAAPPAPKSKSPQERKTVKPRRSMFTYNSRRIETIAKPRKSLDSYRKSSPEQETGLMFIAISPGSNEKRKPEAELKSEQSKRTKAVLPAARPSVRAVKNPSLPKSTTTTKSRDKSAPKSLPANKPLSRVVNNSRKLNLSKPASKTVIHRPNPFASRNMYYDEKWVEKQERGFSKWLNFFLTPQLLDDGESAMPRSIDIANLWSQCSKDVKEPRAPTKEQMSLRQYTVRTEMNRLRKRACQIWQSREVAAVIRKVELEIEKLRLVIRQDRNITKDVGMKQSLLKLILSYNPLWLRIGLETIYGELLPLRDNADLVSMSRFLITRWLSNPDILSEFAHPSVPHSYRDGCQDELNKFAMKKFLELVYFLDIAKETKLIRHNPCLFCPDSQYKSSRELLLVFAKDFLAGEGDLTKHMAYMGYVVCHKQTKLDEFDFAVTNIKTDLRCGVRLAKVAELLAGHSDIMSQLRVPSVSRLQKVHNVDISLAALRAGGAEIRKEIAGKDLVDGHREKTLELLWSIIFGYQLATILNLDNIREEIDHLRRSLNAKARLGDKNAKAGVNWLQSILNRSPEHSALAGERLQLLLEWVRLVLIHYGVEIDNWTTSWCDGRALCLLVHHYQPTLLHRQEIRDQTTITHHNDNQNLDDSADFSYGSKNLDSKTYEGLVENEKNNFKLLLQRVSLLGGVPVLISPSDMTNTIPDEKVTATFIGYLAVRLLDLSREIKAARVIQLAWRKFYAVKMEEKLKVFNKAATVLQQHVRIFLQRRRINSATLTLQKYTTAARPIENWYGALQQRQAAVKLQSWFRGNVARKNYLLQQQSAIKLQSWWKMVAQKKSYSSLVTATRLLQLQWRSRKQGDVVRKNFLLMKNSAVKIQAWWKGSQMRKEFLLKKCSAIIIQKHFRAMRARDFVKRKQAALVCLQRAAAMMKQRKHFLKTKTTIIGLQAHCRAFLARKHHLQLKYDHQYREQLRLEAERLEEQRRETAAVIISHQMRMVVVRKQFLKTRKSAVTIQKFWRGYWHRKVVMEKRNEMAATYKQMKEIKARLEDVTAAARPEDCLAARTDVAIDYIFSIRDVAQLVRAVKTLDVSTRLSLDCCVRMTHMYKSGSPLMQLVSLMARCNRSEPHKEVVSTTLDILINVARVDCTREGVATIPNLLSDIFQAMLVYRDTSAVIFCKCCALLQILSASQIMQSQLTTSQSKKKLVDYHTIVSKKKKLKDENQKRKSINVLAPVSSARKPLRPHNVTSVVATPAKLNTTVTVSTEKKIRQSLDTTVTLKPTKLRKPSLDLATCPPWTFDSNPRHHDDPVTAVTSLNNVLGISI